MDTPTLNEKIIFGLKLKILRQEKGFSLQDLARKSGISISYLNEIEKSKKYPRPQKIVSIAASLGTTTDHLTSKELSSKYTPVLDLLDSNFLQELPLDVFGIDLVKVIEMVAEAPTKVGAFITTLVEMSRLHGQEAEHFYIAAMRAYQEIYNNYFEDIEVAASGYTELLGSDNSTEAIRNFLLESYNIKLRDDLLGKYKELSPFRSVFNKSARELHIQPGLSDSQKKYLLLKETAFQFLKFSERPETNKLWKITSFEQVLNNFNAHYFASCVMMPKIDFIGDLTEFIENPVFDPSFVENWLMKYKVSPELLMHRFNLLPQFLGLDKIFFLRVIHHIPTNSFEIDKELHLSRRHDPQANRTKEHYCRRWLSVSIFEKLKQSGKKLLTEVQRSVYHESGNEYICLTIAKFSDENPEKMISITTGLFIDSQSADRINFINDNTIQRVFVNVTCERCAITDCQERAVDAVILREKSIRKNINKALDKLLSQS